MTDLVALLDAIVRPLRSALGDQGVRLESIGVDPVNDARDVPLQLLVDRYETHDAVLRSSADRSAFA